MWKVFYYMLSDPETNEVCYVGKTTDLERRYKQHCSNPGNFKGNAYMTKWISGLARIGKMPTMDVIDSITEDFTGATSQKERELIKQKWAEGCPLLNRDKFLRPYRKNRGQDYIKWQTRLNNTLWNTTRGGLVFF